MARWIIVVTVGVALAVCGCTQTSAPAPTTAQPTIIETPSPATAKPKPPQPPAAPAKAELRRVHVFVSGKVQGVGFRAFTQTAGQTLGLTGWVTNLTDGRVEAVVEGPAAKVATFLQEVRRGPQRAQVDKVEATDEPYRGKFEGFEVRH